MRRWEKVLLSVSVIGIIGIVSVGIWQRDNIEAGFMFMTNSTEQIAVRMDENKKHLENDLKKQCPTIISDFTAEEEKMIIKGELSVDDAIALIKERYNTAKAEYEKLRKTMEQRQLKPDIFSDFMFEVSELDDLPIEFNETENNIKSLVIKLT